MLHVEKYRSAIEKVARAYQGNLGVEFPLSEALRLAEEVVVSYYDRFHGYLVALDAFTDRASVLLAAINQPETNEYFSEQVLKTVSQHLLDIVAGIRLDEFVAEIVELVKEVVGYKLLQEVGERWKIVVTKIMALSRDPDFRTASYSRQFLEVSTIYDIVTSFPLI